MNHVRFILAGPHPDHVIITLACVSNRKSAGPIVAEMLNAAGETGTLWME